MQLNTTLRQVRSGVARLGKSAMRFLLLGFLVQAFASCDHETNVGSGDGKVSRRDAVAEDWGSLLDKECDIIVGEHLRIAEGFGEFEVDRESEILELRWRDGSVSLAFGGDFTGNAIFGGRSLSKIVEDLSFDDPESDSDNVMRQEFLEGRDGGIIEGGDNIMVFRYSEGFRDIDGVVINTKTCRFVHFVGILNARPVDWKAVASFLFRRIEVL